MTLAGARVVVYVGLGVEHRFTDRVAVRGARFLRVLFILGFDYGYVAHCRVTGDRPDPTAETPW